MLALEPDVPRFATDELDATRDGPDFLDQPDDAAAGETGSIWAKPAAGPDQDVVGQFHEKGDQWLRRQLVLADRGEREAVLVGLSSASTLARPS